VEQADPVNSGWTKKHGSWWSNRVIPGLFFPKRKDKNGIALVAIPPQSPHSDQFKVPTGKNKEAREIGVFTLPSFPTASFLTMYTSDLVLPPTYGRQTIKY
jgi:hypothetical protein